MTEEQDLEELKSELTYSDDELFRDDCPDCGAPLDSGPGGGVVCSRHCGYWFCF